MAVHEIYGYPVIRLLGRGARSVIYEVGDAAGGSLALKHVTRQSSDDHRYIEQAIHEHQVASQLSHPSLRRSHRLLQHRSLLRTTEVVVLMELAQGATLEAFQPAGPIQLCVLLKRVAQGLAHLHQAGWVHADIKPGNILVTGDDAVKVIDFGQACRAGSAKARIQGTPDFMAPEQALRRTLSPATDAFGLGATIYWKLTGRYVPTLVAGRQTRAATSGAGAAADADATLAPISRFWEDCPPALDELTAACLRVNPRHRPQSMAEVVAGLEQAIHHLLHRGS